MGNNIFFFFFFFFFFYISVAIFISWLFWTNIQKKCFPYEIWSVGLGLEYTDCIPYREVRPPPPPNEEISWVGYLTASDEASVL